MPPPVHFNATVRKVERHTPDVASLWLESERRLPRFLPGQFIHLSLDEYDPSSHWPESRVFSVAGHTADRHGLRLTISRQGRYTSRILDEVAEGSCLACKGPYGEFVVGGHGTPAARIALIAGGTGITPFSAFMEQALLDGKLPAGEIRLFYGARDPGLLIYRGLAEQCAHRFPGFRANYYAEQPQGEAGVISGRFDLKPMLTDLGTPAAEWAFYLSGPKTMIDLFRKRLTEEFSVPAPQVLVDAWE